MHIMHWPSPWSEGFPGWNLECSTMSEKYLGTQFDIHGGGMDMKFPHHDCEIAQSVAHNGRQTVRYWMHNNMITINGKKMGKSLGNFITLDEFFTGSHPLLQQAYDPMTIRFFILQAHYRGTIDFSNEALQAAGRAMNRLMDTYRRFPDLRAAETSTLDTAPSTIKERCYEAMDDDFNTPVALSHVFDAARLVNQIHDHTATATADDIAALKDIFDTFLGEIMGMRLDQSQGGSNQDMKPYESAVDFILEMRAKAKAEKDWATCDLIRDRLAQAGFIVKDTKDGVEWSIKK
jgi:cysteinyl-tRNA synthetase